MSNMKNELDEKTKFEITTQKNDLQKEIDNLLNQEKKDIQDIQDDHSLLIRRKDEELTALGKNMDYKIQENGRLNKQIKTLGKFFPICVYVNPTKLVRG